MPQSGSTKVIGWVLCAAAVVIVVIGLTTDTPQRSSTWIYLVAAAVALVGALLLGGSRGRGAGRSSGS